nr:hypothetical protein [Tanacetum cinerariifolium]
ATASVAVSTASPTRNTRVSTAYDITMAETLVYIRKSVAKDKAIRFQAKINKEERQRIAKVHETTSSFNIEEWEDIQARVEVDEELAVRLQAKEREHNTPRSHIPLRPNLGVLQVKSRQVRRRARIVVFDDEDDLEDPSKQGRKITEIDQDPGISLVQHDMEFDFNIDEKDVSTAKPAST